MFTELCPSSWEQILALPDRLWILLGRLGGILALLRASTTRTHAATASHSAAAGHHAAAATHHHDHEENDAGDSQYRPPLHRAPPSFTKNKPANFSRDDPSISVVAVISARILL